MGKRTSKKGINLIKSFEGCRLKAYRCPAGVLTVGYGHTGIDVKVNTVLTQAQADSLLYDDLIRYEKYVNELENDFDYNFTQNEFDALVSFAYNCGRGNLYKLTQNGTRTRQEIANAFQLYNKANGKVLQGLVNRRKAEKELFIKGIETTGSDVNIDMTCNPISLDNVLFRFSRNYNIREIPSINGKVVGSTTTKECYKIKGISNDRQWVLTDCGWVNVLGLCDKIV